MIESQVEQYLVRSLSSIQGLAWKFTSPGKAGVPDRLVLFKGHAFFVELKRPGGKPRALQKAIVKQIRHAGIKVYCISKKEQVDDLTNLLKLGILPEEARYDRI